jgi:DNA-binding MarR family transcriptional regulator
MTSGRAKDAGHPDAASATSREVWMRMSDLVLDNQRRREVSEALGMSFGRTRALRRLARRPMSMRELATALGIDPPNATVVVDDLEAQDLVRRRPHPTDRRAKVVEATRKGKDMARRADEILGTPPAALSSLGADDLEALRRILARVGAADPAAEPDASSPHGAGEPSRAARGS